MQLFKLAHEIQSEWFTDTHSAIAHANTLTELYGLQRAIEAELSRFWLSNKDRVYLVMLQAYCNLRINLMIKNLNRKNSKF